MRESTMSRPRQRGGDRNREQQRLRGRLRTEQMREGQDELDLPDSQLPQAGRTVNAHEPGWDDDRDGDALLIEDDEVATEDLAGEESGANPMPVRVALADLLGARPPVVHLRISEERGQIRVRVCARPWTETAAAALEELADFLQSVFETGRPRFSNEEWHDLLYGPTVPLGQRLLLLSRLAVAADMPIESAKVPFIPHDRGLERYQSKIAALPDGLPFSLRLLLLDRRGKRNRRRDPFLDLPDALLLLAVRRALALERQAARVHSDYEFGPLLRKALAELGVALASAPSEEQVRTLRERRAWQRLGLFPNARSRAAAREP
jgi:hypothetical protein